LAFNLNQICPSEFVIQAANSSERSFLKSIIEQGVTYIADRGYFAFDLIAEIVNKSAFFVFRIKDKIRFVSTESLALTGKIPICFDNVQDDMVRFTNDKNGLIYRIVRFRVWKSYFVLVTNRLDLTTLQVILMYAYRWQIELLFKVIKRTLNGIHLMVQNEKGVKVYFYLLMICCLLQIKLKQDLQKFSIKKKKNEKTKTITSQNPDVWINNINQIFNQGLKISSDWLLYLKNFIGQDIDIQVIDIFNSA
jgi:transposase